MKPIVKGMIIGIIHICLVATLGARLLYDRSTLPRVWVRTAPYDPCLPIRGRYVSLRLILEECGLQETKTGPEWQPPQSVILRVENNRLLAEEKQQNGPYSASDLHVQYITSGNQKVTVLDKPVAFFIPEYIPDPSRRLTDEQLWVEVTIPRKGMPRPIRLGVRKGNSQIVPMDIK